ncbi:MAG TPA: VCBS repeat-containing protein [Planctomycetota bacterium]|jgi:hypothetical protein|nr:VCBS repeat-containing protein [Planctomycetota bacterium]
MSDREPASLASRARGLVRALLSGALSLLACRESAAQAYPLATFGGTSPGDLAGFGVAGPGDVNGDGVPDLIFGEPQCFWYSPCLSACGPGVARVVAGGTGARIWNLAGTAAGEMFGWSVAGAGDVNGDGKADLVIGSLCASSGGIAGAGRATVVSGATGGVLHAFDGTAAGDNFGWSVAGVGDVDGDGVPDVASGSPPGNYVRVFSGATGALLLQLNGSGSFGIVAGLGDVNGDGHADVPVGAWLAGPGQAFVFSGVGGAILHTFNGSFPGDRFGGALAGAGDVDGDSVPDLLVGAGTASPGGFIWAGQAKLFSGATGALLRAFDGSSPGDGLGWSLAGLPDVNGDGVRDVLVGAHQGGNAGFGVPAGPGYARIFSGASGAPLYTATGGATGDAFGRFLAGAGDANGDGVGDFAVGAHSADPGGVAEAGEVELLSVVGIPPGSSLFGSGCPGSSGAVPRIATAGGTPSASSGNPDFALVLSNARPSSFALLIIGVSNSTWLGLPLPLDLSAFGVPGCFLRVAIDIPLLLATTADGLTFQSVPIAVNPALVGVTIYAQWYVVDPGPAPVPGATTAGLAVQL